MECPPTGMDICALSPVWNGQPWICQAWDCHTTSIHILCPSLLVQSGQSNPQPERGILDTQSQCKQGQDMERLMHPPYMHLRTVPNTTAKPHVITLATFSATRLIFEIRVSLSEAMKLQLGQHRPLARGLTKKGVLYQGGEDTFQKRVKSNGNTPGWKRGWSQQVTDSLTAQLSPLHNSHGHACRDSQKCNRAPACSTAERSMCGKQRLIGSPRFGPRFNIVEPRRHARPSQPLEHSPHNLMLGIQP